MITPDTENITTNTPLQVLVNEFLAYKDSYNKHKSVDGYKTALKRFMRYVGDIQYSAFTYEVALKYSTSVNNDSSIKGGTKNNYLRHFRIFLKWLSEEHSLPFNYLKIKVPRMPKKNVKIYSDDEIKLILEKCQTSTPWISLRNKAIVCLMLDTGIRLMEVSTLCLNDLYSDNRCFRVQGKGDKQRLVPFGQTCQEIIMRYLSACPFNDGEHIFFNRRGKPISNNCMKLFFNKLSHSLPFELSAHRCRHNFATDYVLHDLDNGGSGGVERLQLLMGHSEIKTTQIYLHDALQIKAAQNSFSKLDSIAW